MRSVVSRGQQALVKHRTVCQGPLQEDLLSVLHHAVVLHVARLHVLQVRSKDQVAHPMLKEIVDPVPQDRPVHFKEKVRYDWCKSNFTAFTWDEISTI